jgi:hypothetical protein
VTAPAPTLTLDGYRLVPRIILLVSEWPYDPERFSLRNLLTLPCDFLVFILFFITVDLLIEKFIDDPFPKLLHCVFDYHNQ